MKNYVILQEEWNQVSSDYHATKRTRTKVVSEDTTVKEIIEWSQRSNPLGKGNIILTQPEI